MTIPVVEHKRFTVGKYEIIAKPIPFSAHMLRYTVFVDGTRIGAMASMPSESDCLFMEKPPVVPPLVPYQVVYRPGRPRKGTPPRAASEAATPPREELPHGMSFPQSGDDR